MESRVFTEIKDMGLSTQITYGLFREINCIHFERTKECLQSRV